MCLDCDVDIYNNSLHWLIASVGISCLLCCAEYSMQGDAAAYTVLESYIKMYVCFDRLIYIVIEFVKKNNSTQARESLHKLIQLTDNTQDEKLLSLRKEGMELLENLSP